MTKISQESRDVIIEHNGYANNFFKRNGEDYVTIRYNRSGSPEYRNMTVKTFNALMKEKNSLGQKIKDVLKEHKADKAIRAAKVQKANKVVEMTKTHTKAHTNPNPKFVQSVKSGKILKNQLLQRVYTIVPNWGVTQATYKYLGQQTFKLLQMELQTARAKHAGGFNIILKAAFSDGNSDHGKMSKAAKKYYSFTIKGNTISEADIIYQFNKKSEASYDTENYIIYLDSVKIVISPLAVAGGCSDNCKTDKITHKYGEGKQVDYMYIRSYKSKNNNCLFACFNEFYGVKGNAMKPDLIRKELGLDAGAKIDYKDAGLLSDYYNKKLNVAKGYMITNQNNEIIAFKKHDDADYARIYLRDEHYSLFDIKQRDYCKKCGRNYDTSKEHRCNINRVSFKNHKIDKKHDVVRVMDIEEDAILDYSRHVAWDLETFQPTGKERHEIYASGWYNGSLKQSYGKGCFDKTVDEFMTYENKIISAYNGSGFDFHFLVDKLIDRGVEVKNLLLANGKLLTFEFGKGNKVFDLCLFLTCSLDKACKDYKIINSKSSFDHTLMKTWDDVAKYKSVVSPYLDKDVLALKELFETFNNMMYEICKANITSYISTGHMGYAIWCSKLKHVIEIPTEMEKYKFIKAATYGARCYPQKKEYRSVAYEQLKEQYAGVELYRKVLETKDFVFNADATSLYPASMKGFDLVDVTYPTNHSRWSDQPGAEFKSKKIGFYEISYVPPTDIRTPILPTRIVEHERSAGIRRTLLPGTGFYTSVDIENAIECGYKVTFINKCLVYDQSGKVFSDYIDMFYKLKAKAEVEKNDVKRSVAKLFLNSLYGKTLQKAIFDETKIINNVFEFNKFVGTHTISDFIELNKNRLLVTGANNDAEGRITKPCQLGAFVTAYSRRIMLTYMKAIDPTLKSAVFSYSDTDSMHITGADYFKLKELGMIKDKSKAELGYLCSDIDNEGLITYEKNLAPKVYLYEYINNKGEIRDANDAIMKKAGVPKKCLTVDIYKNETTKVLEFDSLIKKHKHITAADDEKGITPFSIVNVHQSKTFLKNKWNNMTLIDNEWFPFGYDK